VVGSGSLITFPTLIALGFHPVLANVSNNIGLVPGGLSGAHGYRRELHGQGDRIRRLVGASIAGGVTGAVLLLVLPPGVFADVVPVLIVLALVLVLAGPRLSRRINTNRPAGAAERVSLALLACIFAVGVYGGYFGAAQGIIVIALLSIFLVDSLQRLNAAKNALVVCVNAAASIVFLVATHVNWDIVGIIAVASTIGGQLGASFGRRLDPRVLRAIIVAVGLLAIVKLEA
jgi:hypothetical protein